MQEKGIKLKQFKLRLRAETHISRVERRMTNAFTAELIERKNKQLRNST